MSYFRTTGLLILFVALFLTGCGASKLSSEQAQPNSVKPVEGVEVSTVPVGWQKFVNGSTEFLYPENWKVSASSTYVAGVLVDHLKIKNTEKDVALGGALPEDYYFVGTKNVNTEKYADSYALINVDIFSKFNTWEEYFQKVYNGDIKSYESYAIDGQPDVNAVKASEVAGVLSGEPHIFVMKGGKVYEISLSLQGVSADEMQKVFAQFLKSFKF